MAEHDGHRKRMLQRMQDGELCEHEYLEVLLYNAVPRKNTGDIAHRLLAYFGTLSGVFAADVQSLCAVQGVGESLAGFIHSVGKCILYCAREQVVALPKRYDGEEFVSYLHAHYVFSTKEKLELYFLDEWNRIYKKREFASNGLYNVTLSASELIESFHRERTSGIVIVHNHVSGDMTPSERDDVTTRAVYKLCAANGVTLCDHFICCSRGVFSYVNSGRLDRILGEINE